MSELFRRALFAVFCLTVIVPSAHAGGFIADLFGGEHGTPTTEDSTAIFYNPAALTLRSGTRLTLNGVVGYHSGNFDRSAASIDHPGTNTPADGITANAGHAGYNVLLATPFAALTTDFGIKGLAAGVGFYVPFGGQIAFDKNQAFRGSRPTRVRSTDRSAGRRST